MRLPHIKFIAAGVLIIGTILILMVTGISDAMVYYYTVPELQNQKDELAGRGLRVSGHVLPGSIRQNGTDLHFTVLDRPTGEQLAVSYQGIVPDTFKDEAEVVVEGRLDPAGTHFFATTVLAKCPSKYEGQAEEHPEEIPVS